MVSVNRKVKAGSVKNPFKDEKIPGWMHYSALFTMALLVTIAFLMLTDQGKSDVTDFHKKHIRQHVQKLKQHLHHHHKNKENNNENNENKSKFAQRVSQSEFPSWLHTYLHQLDWTKAALHQHKNNHRKLDKAILQKSLELGCQNLVQNQHPIEGNFVYQLNFLKEEQKIAGDSQVRQAGALWGLTLCFQQFPQNTIMQESVEHGLNYFVLEHGRSIPQDRNRQWIVEYPKGVTVSETGTNALVGLALIDYLRTICDNPEIFHKDVIDQDRIDLMQSKLNGIVGLLVSLLFPEEEEEDHHGSGGYGLLYGHFAEGYDLAHGRPLTESSPYFDGEALLCLIKYTKYIGADSQTTMPTTKLLPVIQEIAPILFKRYSVDSWRGDGHDSDMTKGFYQWSSMAAAEYYLASEKSNDHNGNQHPEYWTKDRELYRDYVLTMAH